MRVAVALASAGRPALLGAAMANVDRLAGMFDRVVSVPDASSLPAGVDTSAWRIVTGSRGLAAQRNAALDALPGDHVVLFFDDDAVIRHDYVERAVAFFEAHPEVVGLTGRVLIDGATSGEVPVQRADAALQESEALQPTGAWHRTKELYGCNFAVRTSAVPALRFDGRLPLYSWLEDHDFARRLMPEGELAHVDDCVIVHRAAANGGRQAHIRLGYSQVMNPVYLWRKGSFPGWLAGYQIFRPAAKNIVLSVLGDDRSWRRKRLRGNLLALADALRGRITPERILQL